MADAGGRTTEPGAAGTPVGSQSSAGACDSADDLSRGETAEVPSAEAPSAEAPSAEAPSTGLSGEAQAAPGAGQRRERTPSGPTGDSTTGKSGESGPEGSVRLPVVSGDSRSQSEASQGEQIGHTTTDIEEEDLFGSEQESDAAPGTQSLARQLGTGLLDEKIVGDDDLEERELFGSPDIDEKELFGSEDEGPEIDEKELLGDEDEMAVVPAGELAKGKEITPSEPSTMDEREIFGDMSDEEREKVEDVILRRRPAPSDDRVFTSLRLPNVLSIEKTAFRKDSIPQSMSEGYKEYISTTGRQVVKLLNPENCVRWRFKKGPDGENMTDEDGRPQYESNARIVEWEDGSRTMHVGKETFNMSEIADQVLLFEENSQDIHVCHGFVRKRLIATPRNLNSSTHDALKRSQYRKYEPTRRSLLMSQEEQVESKELHELEAQQRRRQEAKQKRSLQQGQSQMNAAFLEDGGAVGASVLDLKRQYKRQKV